MAYGQSGAQPIVASMAIGADTTEAIDIRGANRVAIELPVFSGALAAATTNVYFQVATRATGPFRALHAMGVYSSASGIAEYEIPSGAGSITVDVPPLAGVAFLKIRVSTAATAVYNPVVHLLQ